MDTGNFVLGVVAENGYLPPRELCIIENFCPNVFSSPEQLSTSWKNTSQKTKEIIHGNKNKGRKIYFGNCRISDIGSTTYAVNKLKIPENDLSCINYEDKYVSKARCYIPFYKKKDLFALMYGIHGDHFIPNYDECGNFQYITIPRSNEHKDRQKYLDTLFSFIDEIDICGIKRYFFIKNDQKCLAFLRNGKEKKSLQKYASLIKDNNAILCIKNEFPFMTMRQISYMCHNAFLNKKTIIEIIQDKKKDIERKKKLAQKKEEVQKSKYSQIFGQYISDNDLYNTDISIEEHEIFIDRCKQREEEIDHSVLSYYIKRHVCKDEQNLDISFAEIEKRAEKYRERYEEFEKSEYANYIRSYFSSTNYLDINVPFREFEEKAKKAIDRRSTLEKALHDKGLYLRADSSVCHDYLNFIRDDLDEVVGIMQEMDWFFKYTRYPLYIGRYYENLRDNREFYDYDDDYDDDIDTKSRGEVSYDCKVQALRQFMGMRNKPRDEFYRQMEELRDEAYIQNPKKQQRQYAYIDRKEKEYERVQATPILERVIRLYS